MSIIIIQIFNFVTTPQKKKKKLRNKASLKKKKERLRNKANESNNKKYNLILERKHAQCTSEDE